MGRQLLLSLVLVSVLGSPALAAVRELQPTVQTTPPLSVELTQPAKPAWLTPEKEVELVGVRKILREARMVAEASQTPTPVLSDRHRRKALERAKNMLLNRVEEAQLQAGDVTITSTLTAESRIGFKRSLALAQARYGFTNEAVQTLANETVTGESLLLLVEALVQSGDIPAAIKLADTQLPKDRVELGRQKTATTVFAYIAEEQHKAGDVKARETLNRAVKERPSSKFAHTTDYIHALIPLGRAQAALGDKAASAETFKQALDALSIKRRDRNSSGAFMIIAKAQAENGDRAASEPTFQKAIELRAGPRDLMCLAWAQAVTGQREAALRSFELAIEDAEKLPVEEQRWALSDLVPWQLEIGDREGALETVERARLAGAANVISLEGSVGNWKLAYDMAIASSNDPSRAARLLYIVRTLVKNRDPFGTPELFKKLSEIASTLLEDAPPKDRSDADHMFKNLAVVQAAAGDLLGAQQTIAKISSVLQDGAYAEIIEVLIDKGDLVNSGRILASIKDEWQPFMEGFLKLGSAYAQSGNAEDGLAWARQQQNSYAKANGLLGVAQGLLKRHGIERLWRSQLPRRNLCPDMSKYD